MKVSEVTFETSGGERLRSPAVALCSSLGVWWACTEALGLAMVWQLPREQDVTLHESTETMTKFFSFGINIILYQHDKLPSETFF